MSNSVGGIRTSRLIWELILDFKEVQVAIKLNQKSEFEDSVPRWFQYIPVRRSLYLTPVCQVNELNPVFLNWGNLHC